MKSQRAPSPNARKTSTPLHTKTPSYDTRLTKFWDNTHRVSTSRLVLVLDQGSALLSTYHQHIAPNHPTIFVRCVKDNSISIMCNQCQSWCHWKRCSGLASHKLWNEQLIPRTMLLLHYLTTYSTNSSTLNNISIPTTIITTIPELSRPQQWSQTILHLTTELQRRQGQNT